MIVLIICLITVLVYDGILALKHRETISEWIHHRLWAKVLATIGLGFLIYHFWSL